MLTYIWEIKHNLMLILVDNILTFLLTPFIEELKFLENLKSYHKHFNPYKNWINIKTFHVKYTKMRNYIWKPNYLERLDLSK